MGKGIKTFILIVVLALPALIFLFLYLFGNNQFDVPIQHPEGLGFSDCPDTGTPHTVPDIDTLSLSPGDYKLVFMANDLSRLQLNELRRISSNFPEVTFPVILQNDSSRNLAMNYKQENWSLFNLEITRFMELNRCGFGNISGKELILIDEFNRIRGYYSIDDQKELDRLEGEIKILLR